MSLDDLGVKIVDQGDLETTITKKATEVLISKDQELEQKRLDKVLLDIAKVEKKIKVLERRLNDPRTKISQRKQLRDDIEWFQTNELAPLRQDYSDIRARMVESTKQLEEFESSNINQDDRMPDESERDFLIRTGKITAFGNQNAFEDDRQQTSHVFLRQPGFGGKVDNSNDNDNEDTEAGTKSTIKEEPEVINLGSDGEIERDVPSPSLERESDDVSGSEYGDNDEDNDQEEIVDDAVSDEESIIVNDRDTPEVEQAEERNLDDGDDSVYQTRLAIWSKRRSQLRKEDTEPEVEEQYKPHPTIPDSKLDDKFKLPGDIYPSLFDYQKTCVQWLWELYNQKTGGIIGDEMGLGKTIQVISFLTGLFYSKLLDKPVLIVVPATVLNQWVNEFHKWWPPLRCVILHSIGSGMGKKIDENKMEEFLQNSDADSVDKSKFKGLSNQINAKDIVDSVFTRGHVLITTYVGLRIYSKQLLTRNWGYCILDEGHKIRNPNSDISLLCKQIKTYNRIILSGTPIQNNLVELWSLFDFIFPGRLGTLPIFEQQFAIPINMGGYANASNLQVQTSYKCATILRDLISPYLLRRLKHDVAKDLPKKLEMVLFVKLTQYQQEMYENFLKSEDLNAILKGKRNMLMGVDVLRKICNHPDLVTKNKDSLDYGNSKRSGKLEVTKKLIQLWGENGHKILIFCQTRQMLDILEIFLKRLRKLHNNVETEEKFQYLRMDGTTPISKRQDLVDWFNTDPEITVFLLTTKVGGLGINLTGADRIIIFDPDWNPSTDMQARERAWRLGQKKDIVIYRLMITGSIEEKIYHRQIFKTFLTNKILKDPKQRKFFKMNDLHDLFTLGDQDETHDTETNRMFSSNTSQVIKPIHRLAKKNKNDDDFLEVANIMGVKKMDTFEGDEVKNDEEQIMEGIFSNSNVHSRLKHEEVIENKQNDGVQKEVNKIVQQSLKLLNESRKLTRKNRIGTPTWTGKFGKAGRSVISNSNRIEKKVSSKTILDGLKAHKATQTVESKLPNLLADLILLFKSEDFLTSNQILLSLKHKIDVKNQKDVLVVKSMLQQVCNWDVQKKMWKLKSEYKNTNNHS